MKPELPEDFKRLLENPDVSFQTFRFSPARILLQMVGGVILFLVGAGLLILIGIANWHILWERWAIPFILLAAALIGAGAVIHAVSSWGQCIILVPNHGIAQITRQAANTYRWEEIDAVHVLGTFFPMAVKITRGADNHIESAHLVLPARSSYFAPSSTITWEGGGKKVSSASSLFPDFANLARVIQEKTFQHLWPTVRARFAAGEVVSFDSLSVNQQGIHVDSKTLPWSELKEVVAKENGLVINGKGRLLTWQKIDQLIDIPNVHVCLALIEHARSTLQPSA